MTIHPSRKIKAARMLYPLTRLTSLVNRPGGATRDAAIAEASRRVENCRAASIYGIDSLIASLDGADLKALRRTADSIISLGLTYDLTALAEACKRLGDLAQAFIDRDTCESEPIVVHIRAIHLLNPKTARLSAEAADTILGQLDKVLQHYKVVRQI